jgi:hypothetical protein
MMTQRLKLFYGLIGAVIGLCIGTFLKSFNVMETLSRCDMISLPSIQLKCKLNELDPILAANNINILDNVLHKINFLTFPTQTSLASWCDILSSQTHTWFMCLVTSNDLAYETCHKTEKL